MTLVTLSYVTQKHREIFLAILMIVKLWEYSLIGYKGDRK